MEIISKYNGDSDHSDRSAIIFKDEARLKVECYVQQYPAKLIDVSEHSMRYAEDTAENWVTGIIKN